MIVIAHYHKPLDWVKQIGQQFCVYSTGYSEIESVYIDNVLQNNKGVDANHYLNYIIDNYDNLPDKILFCHHHENDWTQDRSLPEIINNLNWNCADYFSVGAYCNTWQALPGNQEWLRNYAFLLPNGKLPDSLVYIAGTQFVVSKELILKHKKEYYQFLLAWLYYTDMPDNQSGRLFEYTWHYILTGNGVEKQYQNRFK